MKRIFLTHILPEPMIREHGLSSAACNFSFNLMSGGGFDEVFSILGISVSGYLNPIAYNDKRFTLIYNTTFRKLGRIGVKLAVIIEQVSLFFKIRRGSSIWLYNVSTLNVFLYVLLRIFKRSVLINVIELDFTPVEKGCGQNQLFLKVINNCHGNIRLAESPLFTNENSITLPGVVPLNSGMEPLIEQPNKCFLLSGVLLENIAQTSMVLKAFSELPQCELHITGVLEDDSKLKEYASRYSNIIWHGNVSFKEYLDIMHSCTFQLSTRDPKYPENQCNFPSKIIETLLHNRAVISTIEYKQLEDINYFKVDSIMDRFIADIHAIAIMDEGALDKYVNQGKKVAQKFSTTVWNESMKSIELR